jgi:hypothetical protein
LAGKGGSQGNRQRVVRVESLWVARSSYIGRVKLVRKRIMDGVYGQEEQEG